MLGFDCLQYAKMEGGGFCILKVVKNWMVGSPGNKATACSCRYTDFCDDIHTTPQP